MLLKYYTSLLTIRKSYFSFISDILLRQFAYLKTIVPGNVSPILNSNRLKFCIMHCGNADWCYGLVICIHTFNVKTFRWDFKIYNVMCVFMNFEVLPESSLIKKYVCRSPDSASMAPISISIHDAKLQLI